MPHPRISKYKSGDHWVVCDVCGFEYRRNIMKQTWDNKVVCPEDYETRHPLDFVRVRAEDTGAAGLVRVPSAETFVSLTCSTREAIAGEAIAGCAIAGFTEITVPASTFG